MTDRYIGDPGVGELRENGSIGQRCQLQEYHVSKGVLQKISITGSRTAASSRDGGGGGGGSLGNLLVVQ